MSRELAARSVTTEEVASRIKSGDRVFVHGAAATAWSRTRYVTTSQAAIDSK